MSDATPRLHLPYLAAAQAQKHVTLNETLAALDGLVHLAVESRSAAAPATPTPEGALHLVPAGSAFAGWAGLPAGALVRYEAGAWTRLTAADGAVMLVKDEHRLLVLSAGAWVALESLLSGGAETVSRLGVGAAADDTNRLSVKSPAVLFDHATDDLRLVLNKAAASDTASLVLQTGFSGRAELGLAGDDGLQVKVSADGAAWATAIRCDPGGAVELPTGRLEVRTPPVDGVVLAPPPENWSARVINMNNHPYEHGLVVANVWYAAGSRIFAVGNANAGLVGSELRVFFEVRGDGRAEFHDTVRLASIGRASLPAAADRGAGALAFVPDESGGPTVAYSDGSTWRRMRDGAAVS